MLSDRKIQEHMESGFSGIFQTKMVSKKGAWVPGNPLYIYVG